MGLSNKSGLDKRRQNKQNMVWVAKGFNSEKKRGLLFFLAVGLVLITPILVSCGGSGSSGGGGHSSPLHVVSAVASATPVSGTRQTIFNLDAAPSTDSDNGPLSFEWTLLEGVTVALSPSSTASVATFLPADNYAGDYLFSLRAYHGSASDSATVRITVTNEVPSASAEASPGSGARTTLFTLSAGASLDPDNDPLSWQWTQLSGESVSLSPSSTAQSVGFNPDPGYAGDYVFELLASDGLAASADTVRITVSNNPPVAVASVLPASGPRKTIFTLDAGLSSDPDSDPLVFRWEQFSGPSVVLHPSGTAASPSFMPDSGYQGDYLFGLVADDGLAQAGATVRVIVTNAAPVVVLASNVFGYPGQNISLDGAGSFDPDADPITLDWTQVAGATVTLDLSDPLRPAFSSTAIGHYTFQASANDGLAQTQALITANVISPEFKFVPPSGQNRVLVIMANFADTTPVFNASDFQNLLFADTALTMRDYYQTVSYGQLDLIGDFVGWINLSQPKSYYSNNNSGIEPRNYPNNLWAFVEEAVDQAEALGVDFSKYDNDGDGWVDSLIIVHQGRGAQESGLLTDLQTCAYPLSLGRANPRYYDGVKIEYFAIVQEQGKPNGGPRIIQIANFAHEYGHLLGITDTYSWYAGTPYFLGLGRYDMMAYGVYGGDGTRPWQPTQLEAFHKSRLGWLDPVVVTADTTVAIPALETNPFAVKIPTGPDEREYYLLSNRQRIGYDEKLLSKGLFISHVDETPYWQNAEQDTVHSSPGCGYPAGEPKWKHSMIMLEQPDGKFHLEGGVNIGDSVDSWRPGQEFGSHTKPGSLRYDCYPSGVKVSQITESGSTVTARIELGRRQSDLTNPRLVVAAYGFSPSSPSDGDTDSYADPGETLDFSIKLMNLGTSADSLSLQYSTTSYFIESVLDASTYPSLAPGDSADNSQPLRLRIKPTNAGEVPALIKLSIVANGVTYNKVLNVTLGVPGVMVVDDDGRAKAEQKMMLELGRLGYLWTAWETAQKGIPSLEEMQKHRVVLWITGPAAVEPLDQSEISLLKSYLDGGGKLILSSQYLLVNPSAPAADFARNYLRVDSWQDDDSALQYIWPDPASPISSGFTVRKMWTINYYPILPRTVGLTPAPDALGALKNDRMHTTMVQYGQTNGYGIIFSSFGLEHFSYMDGALLQKMLNGASYIPGQPVITKATPASYRPRSYGVSLVLEGLNFSDQTVFSFPEGGINVLSKTYNSVNKTVTLTLQVMFNAHPGYQKILAQNTGLEPAVYDRYLAVSGAALTNNKPIAVATASPASGTPKTVFTLDGTQSSDLDHEPITFQWIQLQGPAITLIPAATAATVSFQPLNCYNGDYLFNLKVWDGTTSSGDTVRLSTLNHAPVPVMEDVVVTDLYQPVRVDANSSYDPDLDLFSFEWAQLAGPTVLFDRWVLYLEFVPTVFADHVFQLSLDDGCTISRKTVEVKVNDPDNHLPAPMVAETFVVGDSTDGLPICFDGRPTVPDGLHDPFDGDTVYFKWEMTSKPSGSAAAISDPSAQMVCFNDDLPGYYNANLRVTDYTMYWSLPLQVLAYSMTADLDNDLLPDEYELAHGMDPANPADASADPDLDGLISLHEYFNGTDPQTAEPWLLSIRDGASAYAGGFFGDADGDLLYGATDLAALSSLLATGATSGYRNVYPPTGETHDFDGNLLYGATDLVVFGEIFGGNTANFTGAPAIVNLTEPASGATITLAVGETVRITVQVTDADGTPRSGSAAIFEAIQGSTIIQFLGGDGQSPAKRLYQALDTVNRLNVTDVAPCLSPDGLEMFLTSYVDATSKYDVFHATRAGVSEPFSPPVPVTELGTTCDEYATSTRMTGDGLDVYLYRDCWNGAAVDPGRGGIFVAHRPESGSTFESDLPIAELNEAAYRELGPWISPDGLTLYYSSNRGGNMDIWSAVRDSDTASFGAPKNVDTININSSYAERYPSLSADQLRVVFISNRISGGTLWDLFEASRPDTASPFSSPVAVNYVNRSLGELTPFLSPDGLELYFAYPEKTISDYDVFRLERPNRSLPFFIDWTPGRFDLTGKMALVPGDPNSEGKAFIHLRATVAGSAKLAVSVNKNSRRLLPAAGLSQFITINVTP